MLWPTLRGRLSSIPLRRRQVEANSTRIGPILQPRHLWLAGVGVAVAVAAAFVFVWHYRFVDTRIYLGALRWWADGGQLYEYAAPGSGLGFTYPPFAALLMAPFAWLPVGVAGWGSFLISVIALASVLVAVLFPVADKYGWSRRRSLAVVLPIALVSEPVRQTLGMGQVDLVLFAFVVADLVAVRRRVRRRWLGANWVGVAIGLAAAIKLTPALFIVYLLVIGQRRAARTAIFTAVGATLATALLVPRTTAQYFGDMLWRTDRVGRTDLTENQSLAGLLARLTDAPHAPVAAWAAVVLAALVVGLARARRAHVEGDEVAAFTLVGLTAYLVSPVSWTHHMLFLLPAVLILADTAWRRRIVAGSAGGGGSRSVRGANVRLVVTSTALLITIVSPFWFFLHRLPSTSHYADGLLGVVGENSVTLLLIALVVALPRRSGMDMPSASDVATAATDKTVSVSGTR